MFRRFAQLILSSTVHQHIKGWEKAQITLGNARGPIVLVPFISKKCEKCGFSVIRHWFLKKLADRTDVSTIWDYNLRKIIRSALWQKFYLVGSMQILAKKREVINRLFLLHNVFILFNYKTFLSYKKSSHLHCTKSFT